MLDKDMRMTVD